MGEAKSKKKRFLAAHPYCCFCGGNEPATTVDHVPPRICFAGRAAPEGFEFPACAKCQVATRLDEMAFGMFVRISDPIPENYRSDEVLKSVAGIRNNLPHLMPFTGLTARDKRAALRDKGLVIPPGTTIAEAPLVGIPAAIDEHVRRYARKLAAALYYKEKGKPVGPDFVFWTEWGTATDRRRMENLQEIIRMSPFSRIGTRTNLNFGNRFGYRYDKAHDNDLFTAIAKFGGGLILVMLVADGESAKEIEEDGWVTTSQMFD